MQDLFQLDYFSILDITWSLLFLVLLFIYVNNKKKEFIDFDYYKYYSFNVYSKLFLGLLYALYYIIIVDGGDTLAYWDGALKMNALFWHSPSMYFNEMFNDPDIFRYASHFNINIGLPPRWIYMEKESWFITKIVSIFTFVLFKSYLVTMFVLAYISSIASWKLFQLVYNFQRNSTKHIAFAALFLPSVGFWCCGINKDTIVYAATLCIIYHLFKFLSPSEKTSYKNYLWIAFSVYLLYHIRDFMILTIVLPFVFAYSARIVNKYRKNTFALILIRFVSIVLVVLFFYFQGDGITSSSKLEEAAVIQKDFSTNDTYTGSHYDLGITDFTGLGMLKAFPVAVIAGFYRPFIWESLKLTLISNGIEGLYLLYLTFLFFRRNFLRKINLIRKHEFFIFAFFFALLLGYMSGVTSGLLGVLVRFKAPLLPFLVLLLTISIDFVKNSKTEMNAESE